MKLGLISDIHGDEQRLRMALDVLNSKGVDQILCAGDVVYFLRDAEPCVQLLQDCGITSVRGNHDRWYADYHEENPKKNHTYAYTVQMSTLLPLKFDGVSLLLAHGAPWDDMQVVNAGNLPYLRHQFTAYCQEYEVIILGHTHVPMYLKWNNSIIVNPGSVCKLYPQCSETCAVLSLPEIRFEVFKLQTGESVDVPMVEVS